MFILNLSQKSIFRAKIGHFWPFKSVFNVSKPFNVHQPYKLIYYFIFYSFEKVIRVTIHSQKIFKIWYIPYFGLKISYFCPKILNQLAKNCSSMDFNFFFVVLVLVTREQGTRDHRLTIQDVLGQVQEQCEFQCYALG